jgi:hypothetical protein
VGEVDYATGTFNDWTNLGTQKALDVNSIPQALSMNLDLPDADVRSGLFGGNKSHEADFSAIGSERGDAISERRADHCARLEQ